MTSQIKDRARSAGDRADLSAVGGLLGRTPDLVEATTKLTEQAQNTTVVSANELQDVMLAMVRQSQEATVALMGMWTDTLRRPDPFGGAPARAATNSGYDLLTQLLVEGRQFVDAVIDQQRRIAEALLTPPQPR